MDADAGRNADKAVAVNVNERINAVPDRSLEWHRRYQHRIAVRRDRLTVFRTMTGTELGIEDVKTNRRRKERGRLAVKPDAL